MLLGQYHFKVHTAETNSRARECLERAVEIDPDYAEAWAHLANQYREGSCHGWRHEPDALARAARAAKRAIALDGGSAMAHYALSLTLLDRHEFEPAVAAAERAIALNPNDNALAAGLSLYLAKAGRLERALALTHEVERLNPLQPNFIHNTRALVHYENGEFEEARFEVAGRERGPTAPLMLAASYGQLGRKREARETWQQILDRHPSIAANPMGHLRQNLYREDLVERVAEGLRRGGIDLE